MNNKVVLKYLLISGSIIALLVTVVFGQDEDLKSRFESEYKAWKTMVDNNIASSLATTNPHLYEIVKMGVPVLPLIIEKMEKKEYARDFSLGVAFALITKKVFEKEDFPEGAIQGDAIINARMYIDWWHNGIKNTSDSFNRYYQEWKRYLAEKNTEEAEKKLKNIKNLGIAAIPFMIDKIKEGDMEFIKIISDHTNGSLNENASKDECIQWWKENSDKYTIIKDE